MLPRQLFPIQDRRRVHCHSVLCSARGARLAGSEGHDICLWCRHVGSTNLEVGCEKGHGVSTRELAGVGGYQKVSLFTDHGQPDSYETEEPEADENSSILSRVPTDAQLTIHLLRVAEALETPLPRAP